MLCGPPPWSCTDREWIRSRRISSWALLVSAKEFTGARYCSWMGRRRREEEGQRVELARPHGKNWICFHSSSNKQWGNFASAHLWLNTLNSEAFKTGNFRAVSQLLWAKYLQGSTAQVLLPYVCATASKGSSLTINLLVRHICFDLNFWTSPRRKQKEYI